MLDKQEIEARNKCDRFMSRGVSEIGNHSHYGHYRGLIGGIEVFSNKTFGINTLTLSQCTGVKDINGVMIFENDIVRVYGENYVIKHDGSVFIAYNAENVRYYYLFKDKEITEIIGDNFSNPELLVSSE